jgi:hypothetical protein
MAEPNDDHPGGGTDADPDRVSEGVAALSELAAAGVEVDGEVQIAESTCDVECVVTLVGGPQVGCPCALMRP